MGSGTLGEVRAVCASFVEGGVYDYYGRSE